MAREISYSVDFDELDKLHKQLDEERKQAELLQQASSSLDISKTSIFSVGKDPKFIQDSVPYPEINSIEFSKDGLFRPIAEIKWQMKRDAVDSRKSY